MNSKYDKYLQVKIDGKDVDRSKVGFYLVPDPNDPKILVARDGTTYERMSNGSLRRRKAVDGKLV